MTPFEARIYLLLLENPQGLTVEEIASDFYGRDGGPEWGLMSVYVTKHRLSRKLAKFGLMIETVRRYKKYRRYRLVRYD